MGVFDSCLPHEFPVPNGAFQLAIEKVERPACLFRMGETFCGAPFDCLPASRFPIEPGFDDLLLLSVPVPVHANDAVGLTLHHGTSNSKLNGVPAPVASNSEINKIASGGRGMNAFRCVTG